MTFWDWADKHPVAFVLAVLIVAMAIPSFTYRSGAAALEKSKEDE